MQSDPNRTGETSALLSNQTVSFTSASRANCDARLTVPPERIILDMDSSESPTHGEQEGSAWNGHFGCTCYHPLFLSGGL
jgi:hypothetical protein